MNSAFTSVYEKARSWNLKKRFKENTIAYDKSMNASKEFTRTFEYNYEGCNVQISDGKQITSNKKLSHGTLRFVSNEVITTTIIDTDMPSFSICILGYPKQLLKATSKVNLQPTKSYCVNHEAKLYNLIDKNLNHNSPTFHSFRSLLPYNSGNRKTFELTDFVCCTVN